MVVYPARDMTSGSVARRRGSGSQPMWVYENVPVNMSARAGIVGNEDTT
jgi:hypothetical protein